MELSQRFPVILITENVSSRTCPLNGECNSHPVDYIAERFEGIPVMNVDG